MIAAGRTLASAPGVVRTGCTPIALASLFLVALGVGPVAAQTEVVEYYGQDALGSIRIVFDVNGVATARADFEPFGELFTVPGMPGGQLPAPQFTGQERDPEASQDYFGARFYTPRTGRFSQVDPVYAGLYDPQQWNRYAYVRNNPLMFTDPDGREQTRFTFGFSCPPDCTIVGGPPTTNFNPVPLPPVFGTGPGLGGSRPAPPVRPGPGDRGPWTETRPGPVVPPICTDCGGGDGGDGDGTGTGTGTGTGNGTGSGTGNGSVVIAMVSGFAVGAAQGLAASIDGALPFGNPFARLGAYDPNGPGLRFSYNVGGTSLGFLAGALPGTAGKLGSIRWLPNVKGPEWRSPLGNVRVGWHLVGGRYLPHYHRRPGIGKHRPWEGGW